MSTAATREGARKPTGPASKQPMPAPINPAPRASEAVTIRLTPADYQRLEAMAYEQHTQRATLARELLLQGLEAALRQGLSVEVA